MSKGERIRDLVAGQNVQMLRMRSDRSQQWLADQMRQRGHRWSQATVWAVEKGERQLRLTEAEDLGEILPGPITSETWTAAPRSVAELFDSMQPQMLWHHATGLAVEVERLAQRLGEAMAALEEVQARVNILTTAAKGHAQRPAREDQADGERQ